MRQHSGTRYVSSFLFKVLKHCVTLIRAVTFLSIVSQQLNFDRLHGAPLLACYFAFSSSVYEEKLSEELPVFSGTKFVPEWPQSVLSVFELPKVIEKQ